MSQENVELVRGIYDAVARRDSESVLALYDPEVEWDMSRGAWRELDEAGRSIAATRDFEAGSASSGRSGRSGGQPG